MVVPLAVAAPAQPARTDLWVFGGAARTDLAGGPGDAPSVEPGPLGSPPSAGTEIRERRTMAREGWITHGQVGLAGIVRRYLGAAGRERVFAGLGASLGTQILCDHGLTTVIASPEGDLRMRSLAVLLHYRLGGH